MGDVRRTCMCAGECMSTCTIQINQSRSDEQTLKFCSTSLTNQLSIRQFSSMAIFRLILINTFLFECYSLNSSCFSCTSILFRSCSYCLNQFPVAIRSNVEKISIFCNSSEEILREHERFYSTIQSYTSRNCTMKVFYLDQFILWKSLQSMSITYAHLTRFSTAIFNQSFFYSPPILSSMKTLNLSHNALRLINKNFSSYFPSLEKLDFSFNRLILLRRKTFLHLIHLKELYLNNNHLRDIFLTILPRQSLRLIDLSSNPWYCSCTNVLTLSISRPIPSCRTPIQYRSQNAGDIARQCFLRTKAIILVTTNLSETQNLTCALSSTIDIWKNKTNTNITLLSAWHIEQHRPIALEFLYALSRKSDRYLICFRSNSSAPDSIHTIIPLTVPKEQGEVRSMNLTTIRTLFPIKTGSKLSPFLLGLFHLGKSLLPKSFRTSKRQVSTIWLMLLTFAFGLASFLIFFLSYQRRGKAKYQVNSSSHRFLRFDRNLRDHRTIFNLKLNCKNHKCLCQYRRHGHLTKSTSSKSIILSNIEPTKNQIHPLLIEPAELRFAKIKRISSIKDLNNDYLAGQFRTIVTLKSSLPNG